MRYSAGRNWTDAVVPTKPMRTAGPIKVGPYLLIGLVVLAIALRVVLGAV